MLTVSEMGGQVVRPLQGRAESRPWQVEVLDSDNYFTALLADSGGRMVLLRRLVDVQASVDGGAYATVATGRLADIQDHVSHYTLSIEDERLLERTANIFTQCQASTYAEDNGTDALYQTAYVIPPGPTGPYGNFKLLNYYAANATPQANGNYVLCVPDKLPTITMPSGGVALIEHGETLNGKIINQIKDDLKADYRWDNTSTEGNFNTLRAEIATSSGTFDYEVVGFGSYQPVVPITSGYLFAASPVDQLDEAMAEGTDVQVWVVFPSYSTQAFTSVRLYMPTHEPTDVTPLLIGGATGIHPYQLYQDNADEVGVRCSTVLTDLIADNWAQTGWWRITSKANMARWHEDHTHKPYGVVPFVDQDGKVAPQKVLLPQSSEVGDDITTLTEVTESDASFHSWRHSAEDQVTAITFKYTKERMVSYSAFSKENVGEDFAADLIDASCEEVMREHDRISEFGRHEDVIQFSGLHSEEDTLIPDLSTDLSRVYVRRLWGVDSFANMRAREAFQRAGDGPIEGRMTPYSSAVDFTPGDRARFTIATFPTPQSSARGGTRLVQVVSRHEDPAGPQYEWADLGPGLNPSTVGTLALAQSTSDPNHTVKATVGGLPSSAGWQLQTAYSTSATAPAEDSDTWQWREQGDSSGVFFVPHNPSGTIVHGRMRTTLPNQTRSAWSTAANTTMASLTAPSGISVSGITGAAATVAWVTGEDNYPLEIVLDQATTCATATLESVTRLAKGSETYPVTNLTADSTYCVGVRHYDVYGGVSAVDSTAFESASTTPQAPALTDFVLVLGSTC
jgi:hypothetical protein